MYRWLRLRNYQDWYDDSYWGVDCVSWRKNARSSILMWRKDEKVGIQSMRVQKKVSNSFAVLTPSVSMVMYFWISWESLCGCSYCFKEIDTHGMYINIILTINSIEEYLISSRFNLKMGYDMFNCLGYGSNLCPERDSLPCLTSADVWIPRRRFPTRQ